MVNINQILQIKIQFLYVSAAHQYFYNSIAKSEMKPSGQKYSSANVILKEKEEMGALLLGDCNSAVDNHIIKPYKVQTIFTFGSDAAPQKKDKELAYKLYNVLDNKSQKIGDILDQIFDEIETARKIGGVLLHCYTGISRSPSFAISYLMRKKELNYDDAKKLVKKQRAVIHPNDNFHRQLQTYEKILKKRKEQEEERNRLLREKEPQMLNQSSNFSSLSNISKRSKGVKGAVRPAHRSISPNKKSLEKTEEVVEKKSPIKQYLQLTKAEESTQKSREKSKKEVVSVYSAKTKVL